MSRDPILGGSANDYEYTSGDPVNRLDLSGTHHLCSAYPNPNCKTTPKDEAAICAQAVAAGAMQLIKAACHSPNGTDLGYSKNSDGTYTIIIVRTGQIIARDLGRSDALRRLSSQHPVNRNEVGIAAAEGIPYWGVGISAYRCERANNANQCGIAATAGAAASLVPSPWALLTIPVGAGSDLAGQLFGGASLW